MSFLSTQDHAIKAGLSLKQFPVNTDVTKDFTALFTSKFSPQYSGVFLENDCKNIIEHFEKDSKLYPVSVHGLTDLATSVETGSHRITVHDINFAKVLTSRLWANSEFSLGPIVLNTKSPVDWLTDNPDELNYWVPLHVSPVFRYMRYKTNGQHFAHYDSPFYQKETPLIRTLQSGVLYLSSNNVYTRFLHDSQSKLDFTERDHSDWGKVSEEDDIRSEYLSDVGNALIFPHQLLHDVSENLDNEDRIIVRFDIFYQAVGKV